MKKDQREFIKSLIGLTEKKILYQKIPKNWDGLQLRWHIRDMFKNVVFSFAKEHPKDYKEYTEYKTIFNLWGR